MPTQCRKTWEKSFVYGRIHLPHLRIGKYFMDNLSVNSIARFFFISCQILAKIEEIPCYGNLRMSHPLSTYGSISETGEFGLHVKIIIFYTELTRKVDLLSCLTSEKYRYYQLFKSV